MTSKIYLGSDHAGLKLKEQLNGWLDKNHLSYEDLGNTKLDPKDDYPDFAKKVALKVAQTNHLGVLICGSAQGMCITANKVKGVRAVVPYNLKEARLSKEHNDANVLCLSGWFAKVDLAQKMVKIFLSTGFTKEKRHVRRLNKIRKLER